MTEATRGPSSPERTALGRALGRVRRRWFWLVWSRAFTWMAAGAALVWGAVVVTRRLLEPGDAQVFALVAAGAVVTFAVVLRAAWPLRRRPSDWQVARYVEERVAGTEERLSTAVGEATAQGLMAPLVVRDAARFAGGLDLDVVVPRGRLRQRVVTLAMVGALALVPLALAAPSWVRAWQFALVSLVPSRVSLSVVPGSGAIDEGERVDVRAEIRGLPSMLTPGPVTLEVEREGTRRLMAMAAHDEAYLAPLGTVDGPVTLRVRSPYATSPAVTLDVVRRPRIAHLRVHYEYPGHTGLDARVDEGNGDIYAPAGTRVRLEVSTTEPVRSGALDFADRPALVAEPTGDHHLSASFVVEHDTSYRIGLEALDGRRVADTTEYFVRAVDDRPPDVRILRPGGDRRVTRLEEVVVEARADDDYGVEALDLVVAVRGGEERAIPLRRGRPTTAATGATTLYLEDLGVEPGDFVSYYARAREVGRGRGVAPARSDIFFLEVRPFNEEFEAAQSQAQGQAGDDGGFDDLVAEQKDIIIATWKLERRATAGRSSEDAATVARAQREVRTKAERLAAQSAGVTPLLPGRTGRPGEGGKGDGGDGGEHTTPMERAVAAMQAAEAALSAVRPQAALPHEMTALNELLRAQAEVRRRQVSQQRASAQGRGRRNGNEDLSALFDRELQRQQQTNYELPNSVEQREDRREDDAMARLRELARRQDDLARAQRELARQQASLSAEEARRRLERLTREQEALRQQAERLARQMRSEAGASGQQGQPRERGEDARAMEQAARDMASAAAALGEQNASAAEGFGQRASERLRETARRMGAPGSEPSARRAGDLQLSASELAEAERRLADRIEREGRGVEGTDALRRLAGEQERLAERAADLARTARQAAAGERDVAGGARTLAERKVDDAMRRLGQDLREAAGAPQGSGERASRALAERGRQVATDLARAAEAFGRAAGLDQASRDDARRLARARSLGEELARIERGISDTTQRLARANQAGQPAEGGQGSGNVGDRAARDQAGRDLERLQQEYARASRELGELNAEAGSGTGGGGGMATPEAWEPSRSAPGTEAFKQDYARWESLRHEMRLAVERLEASLAARLNAGADTQRLDLGGNDQVPERYRDAVARYFRATTTEGPRR